MEFHILDHLIVLYLVAIAPLKSIWEQKRLKRLLSDGSTDVRLRIYRMVMVSEWVFTLAILAIWFFGARSYSDLGLGLELGGGTWVGAVFAISAAGLLILQTKLVLSDPEKVDCVRKAVRPLEHFMPHSQKEGSTFAALSVTAGICEELIYRGFLIAYLGAFVGLWMAVLLSTLVFGLGHAYQGFKGVLKTGGVGLVMAGLYVLTGSLWVPMILHAVVDLNSGYLTRRSLEARLPETAPAAS